MSRASHTEIQQDTGGRAGHPLGPLAHAPPDVPEPDCEMYIIIVNK